MTSTFLVGRAAKMRDKVLQFIKAFSNFGDDVIDCFTCGNCYWFAHILSTRFQGLIVYDVIANHFGCQVGADVFDITGIVNNQYHWQDWYSLEQEYDPLVISRIYRDCVNF